MKADVTVAARSIDDAVIEHVRQHLAQNELAKIRIRAERREMCAEVADELARRVPCEIVTRVGRVVLLYREKAAGPPPPGEPPSATQ